MTVIMEDIIAAVTRIMLVTTTDKDAKLIKWLMDADGAHNLRQR